MIEITVENVEQTLRNITQYSVKKTKNFDDIVRKYAKEVAKRAKANAPVGKTGNLKASIKPKYFTKQGPSATVFPRGGKGAHRHLVEYGTNMRHHKKSGKSVGRARSTPFMKPAQDSVVGEYLREIQKEVDKDDTV